MLPLLGGRARSGPAGRRPRLAPGGPARRVCRCSRAPRSGSCWPARAIRPARVAARPITGIEEARRLGALVFHAGTAAADGGWTTNGGRVLTVVGRGADLAAARAAAERAADAITLRGPPAPARHRRGEPRREVLAR